jgi:hypothetical protein
MSERAPSTGEVVVFDHPPLGAAVVGSQGPAPGLCPLCRHMPAPPARSAAWWIVESRALSRLMALLAAAAAIEGALERHALLQVCCWSRAAAGHSLSDLTSVVLLLCVRAGVPHVLRVLPRPGNVALHL